MASLRIIKFIGAYTILGFVPLAVSFFLLPLYTNYLIPAEYGVLAIANLTQTFATLALSIGLDAAFGRFYFDYLDSPELTHRLLGTVVFSILGLAVVLGLGLAVGGDWLFSFLWQGLPFHRYGWYVFVGGLMQVIFGIVFLWYRNGENLRMAMAVSLTSTAAQTAGSILAVAFVSHTALGAVAGRTLGFALGVTPFTLVLLRRVPLAIDFSLVRKLLRYGLPLFAYTVIAYVLFNGDRILMQRWYPLQVLGLYALAATLVFPMEIILQSAQQAVQPMFYRMLERKDPTVAGKIGSFYSALTLLNIAGMVGVVLVAEPLLVLMRGTHYRGATHYIAILAYAQLFRVQYNAFAFSLFYRRQQTQALPIVTGLSLLVGVAVAWVSCRLWGPLGVGVGVAGWKFFQRVSTQWAMRRSDTVQVGIRGSDRWVLAAGIYTLALYLVEAKRPELYGPVSWGAGVILAALALVACVRFARTAGMFQADVPEPLTAAPADG